MIPLSPRLLCCASMITGDFVCDIGTDHAFLPVYLVMSGKCTEAIATDIREGPLETAKNTLRKHGVSGSIRLILTDGFRKVPDKNITDVVIAGMGGESIRDILADDAAKWIRRGTNLVLQPMTKSEVLRSWLAENGFPITKEAAVKDTHVYSVIQTHYTGETRTLTGAEPYVGKLRRSDKLTRIYLAGVQDRLHTKANGLDEAGHTEESAAVRETIRQINEWMEGIR